MWRVSFMVHLFWKDVILLKSHNIQVLHFYNFTMKDSLGCILLSSWGCMKPVSHVGNESEEMKIRNSNNCQKLRSQKGSLSRDMLRASRMIQSCWHFDLELFSSIAVRKMNLYCFKSPQSMWYFVTVSLGNTQWYLKQSQDTFIVP